MPRPADPDRRQPQTGQDVGRPNRGDAEPLRFVDMETLTAAFQRVETRKVDKTGCISFGGQQYEVGGAWVGHKVDVVYDPTDRTEVTIEAPGAAPWTARPLQIGEHVGIRPPLPEHLGLTPPTGSRVLQAAAERHAARRAAHPPAVSFRGLTQNAEGEPDV